MFDQLANWLAHTTASHFIQEVTWIVPLTQTVHILCVAIVMFATCTLSLRLSGLAGRKQSLSAMMIHFSPWIWTALAILLATGSILTIGEPVRELLNATFRLKMVLVVCAAVLTAFVQVGLRQHADFWETSAQRRWIARGIATTSLCLWIAIVFCGRLIAYFGAL